MIIRISSHARPRSAVQGHYGVASSLFLRLLPLLLVACGRAAVSGSSSDGGGGIGSSSRERCEEITIPMCRGIGYNFTSMPNQFHHDTQEEAGLEVHQFWPLVEIQCSDDLRFFLCSMYAPICMEDYQERLPACRSVCERARAGCAPIMLQYGFAWPERMSCEELPEFGDQERLCMDAKNGAEPENPDPGIPGSTTGTGSGQRPRIKDPKRPSFRGRPFRGRERQDRLVPSNNPNMGLAPAGVPGIPGIMDECSCECRLPNVLITDHTDHRYYNKVETGSIMNCAVPCRGKFFNKEEQNFATFWIGLWAVLCCISTSMTVLTFLIDMQRFRYPERPIIFLSGCYLMISIGYIVRLFMGHEAVACDGPVISYHVTGRQDSCTVVFLLIYFFGMASSLWWVILTLTWLLAAGLKWGNEAIAGYSQYFHLAAWLVPTVKSIVILAIGAVDGDPIAGVCSVGNQDLGHLRGFVLAPLCVYLLLGTSFLLAGFVALFRIRNVIRQQARAKADKLEKLMIRIGVFSVLYTLPATIVIGCYVYEQHFRHLWERKINCPCTTLDVKPDYSVFMLKYFMCLVVGITSGFWIWSGKTLDSWKRFRSRFFCNRGIDEDHRHHHHAVMGGIGLPGSGLIPVGGVLGCTPSAVMMTDPQSGSQIRAFKPMSPVSHVGQVPSSHGKHMPLSHV